MNENSYIDRETGDLYQTGIELIDIFIQRFAKEVSTATGASILFEPLDSSGFTSIKRGSAIVGINVLEQTGALIFISHIMEMPNHDESSCFRLLLELNYSATYDAAFAIDKSTDSVCLKAQRSIRNLDYDEFVDTLNSIATVADEWDDKLINTFQKEKNQT